MALSMREAWSRMVPDHDEAEPQETNGERALRLVSAGSSDTQVGTRTTIPLDDLLGSMVVPKPDDRPMMLGTLTDFIEYRKRKSHEDAAQRLILRGVQDVLEEEQQAQQDNDTKQTLLQKLFRMGMKWLVKRVLKTIMKWAFRMMFGMVRWLFRQVIVRGLMLMVQYLVLPVLTAIGGFIVSNPITLGIAALLGGVAYVGYKIWDNYYGSSGQEPATPSLLDKAKEKLGLQTAEETKRKVAAEQRAKDARTALKTAQIEKSGIAAEAPTAKGKPGAPEAPVSVQTQSGQWHLGQTSAVYESGGKGPATISTGKGDLGGVSYGTYQLASKTGTLQEFLRDSGYAKSFEGLTPGTAQFNAKWKDLAANDPKFGPAQHDFIKATHFDQQLKRLAKAGFDVSARGPAVLDAIWSTSVQFRNLTTRIVTGALADVTDWKSLKDSEIVSRIQDYKYNNTETMFRSSPTLWNGLRKRAASEKSNLVALAKTYEDKPNTEAANDPKMSPDSVKPAAEQIKRGSAAAAAASSGNPPRSSDPEKTPIRNKRGQIVAVSQ